MGAHGGHKIRHIVKVRWLMSGATDCDVLGSKGANSNALYVFKKNPLQLTQQ